MGYGTYNFIKYFKGSGVPRASILNIKSRKNRREHCYRKLKKGKGRKKYFLFQTPKNSEDLVRCSVR